MAREHGRSIESVASDSYALTLWTYLQSEEAEHFASLVREFERIDAADMLTRGFIKGTQPVSERMRSLVAKATVHVPLPKTREQLSEEADELWARHMGGISQRPVS